MNIMAYLTRIRLAAGPDTMRVLANRERLHAVMAACGGDGRILYRQEGATLYATGPGRFDLDGIRERLDVEQAETTGYDRFLDSIRSGMSLRFKVVCAPVKTVDGRKIPLHDRGERRAWLERTLQRHGADLRMADIGSPERIAFTRKGGTVVLTGITMQGILHVDDADGVRRMLTEGIGTGRAYGMGMITVSR
ncbi:type I-E CRISPR-associated protein Cas6/Cse3/CasE [Bifidobacterium sp. SO1]|uniref:type I-E CRISPR-associated protein Cas6/Cse3/CasE n=1 Tax=Bifidobacterium sp. SO1 TaxID=2809029 RepID=UPI001BDBF16C|nr:type I-E CRISPR-associated protein Cas6/Cse3/CasE [Bifidobacterium sp. SO1]MBT1161718.1 type I-E CRISPR-associated protein Cas6/Cse3/CasE [Bifidobacterium sp. SO1]